LLALFVWFRGARLWLSQLFPLTVKPPMAGLAEQVGKFVVFGILIVPVIAPFFGAPIGEEDVQLGFSPGECHIEVVHLFQQGALFLAGMQVRVVGMFQELAIMIAEGKIADAVEVLAGKKGIPVQLFAFVAVPAAKVVKHKDAVKLETLGFVDGEQLHLVPSFDGHLFEGILAAQVFQIFQEGGQIFAGLGGIQLKAGGQRQKGIQIELVTLAERAAVQIAIYQLLANGVHSTIHGQLCLGELVQEGLVLEVRSYRGLLLARFPDGIHRQLESLRPEQDIIRPQPGQPVQPILPGQPFEIAEQRRDQMMLRQFGIGLIDAGDAKLVHELLHLAELRAFAAENGDRFRLFG